MTSAMRTPHLRMYHPVVRRFSTPEKVVKVTIREMLAAVWLSTSWIAQRSPSPSYGGRVPSA